MRVNSAESEAGHDPFWVATVMRSPSAALRPRHGGALTWNVAPLMLGFLVSVGAR
jgi:hypothetical protein